MNKGKRLKQFCINGHEIAIVGRDKWGGCLGCRFCKNRLDPAKDARIKNICINGHDVSLMGRTNDGHCRKCKDEYNSKYIQEHLKELLIYQKEYNRIHRKYVNARVRKYIIRKFKTDIIFKLKFINL